MPYLVYSYRNIDTDTCHALVICKGLHCLPSAIKMRKCVDVIATEDRRWSSQLKMVQKTS